MEAEIIRSRRSTISIEVTSEAKIRVRAPLRVSERRIRELLEEKEEWIEKAVEKAKKRKAQEQESEVQPLSQIELRRLADQALQVIPEKTAFFAEQMGVTYGRITIRAQRTRWGSCTGKGNLNFNCLLMLAPEPILDYVVVHELCHRKEMNHSAAFWSEVEKVLPDYRERRGWLKQNGGSLIRRIYPS